MRKIEFALDALCLLLAVIATGLVVRASRHYMRLLEDRATELEEFAGRVAHDILSPLGVRVGRALARTVSSRRDRTTALDELPLGTLFQVPGGTVNRAVASSAISPAAGATAASTPGPRSARPDGEPERTPR